MTRWSLLVIWNNFSSIQKLVKVTPNSLVILIKGIRPAGDKCRIKGQTGSRILANELNDLVWYFRKRVRTPLKRIGICVGPFFAKDGTPKPSSKFTSINPPSSAHFHVPFCWYFIANLKTFSHVSPYRRRTKFIFSKATCPANLFVDTVGGAWPFFTVAGQDLVFLNSTPAWRFWVLRIRNGKSLRRSIR